MVQSKEAKWIQAKKGGGSQRNDGNQGTCLYVWLNAEGRRISESRVRENRMHGLMRGRWISHCSTLSKGHKHILRLEDCCQSEIETRRLLSKGQNEKLRLADCCHLQARPEDYSPGDKYSIVKLKSLII